MPLSRSKMPKIYYFTLLFSVLVLLFFYQKSINSFLSSSRQTFQPKSPLNFRPPNSSFRNLFSTGNVPDIYFLNSTITKQYNRTCAKFPSLFDLSFRNDYWQVQETSNGTLHLFNAYFDDRNGSVVRVVGMYNQVQTKTRFFCHLWYEKWDQVLVVEASEPLWLWRTKWWRDIPDLFHPYLFTCPLPKNFGKVPMSVSLVEHVCQNASNNLKVFRKEAEAKKDFVVCVKGLDFPYEDKSARLAEWIELLGILGASKINFYEFAVHPNTRKLLDYYETQGLVEVTPLTLVGDYSNRPRLQHLFLRRKVMDRRLQEVIPYNDCLYKHLREFKYVVLLDTDEVVVPTEGTWGELMEEMQKTMKNQSAYVARNVYFLDSHLHDHDWFEGIPHHMHMLQHVFRAQNYTPPGFFVKGFHDTDRVVGLHNHLPIHCLGDCLKREIDVKLAHLQHYRGDCVRAVKDCEEMRKNSVMDARIWNYKDELVKRVERVFQELGFLT